MKKILIAAIMLCSLTVMGKKKCCEGRCSGGANCSACSNCNYCGHCNSGGTCSVCRPDLYDGRHRAKAAKKQPVKSKKTAKKKTAVKNN